MVPGNTAVVDIHLDMTTESEVQGPSFKELLAKIGIDDMLSGFSGFWIFKVLEKTFIEAMAERRCRYRSLIAGSLFFDIAYVW